MLNAHINHSTNKAQGNIGLAAMEPMSWKQILLRGARTFPHVPWRSEHRWRTQPVTLLVLMFGLVLFGVGEALIVDAGIGNSPWTVLAQGLTLQTGIAIGGTSAIVSVAVLLLWIPLRERPGLGTVLNAFVIGYTLQFVMAYLPEPTNPLLQTAMVFAGILTVGMGSTLYITTNLGPGPRDGLMTAIHERTGWPVARTRLAIEICALAAGAALGGTIGVGTVLFAALMGRALALWLGVLGRLTARA